jgi:hypothetical protein
VRKGLFKWLYPDAHDTTENMGNKLEAYFDKATGKWVFPGEVILLFIIPYTTFGAIPNPVHYVLIRKTTQRTILHLLHRPSCRCPRLLHPQQLPSHHLLRTMALMTRWPL